MSRTLSSTSYLDAASLLPRKPVQEFGRKHTIYGPGQPSSSMYLVRSGRVLITNSIGGSEPAITRIVGPDGIFGEGSLVGSPDPGESAMVLDQARVMSWSRNEIEQQVGHDPRLGLALLACFVQRCAELNARLEALAFRKTPERVMLGLLQLAESLGTPVSGAMRLGPLTHQAIAEYVGTSREIVTSHMTEFRRAGMIQYSRKYIDVNVTQIRDTLRRQGIEVLPAEARTARAAF